MTMRAVIVGLLFSCAAVHAQNTVLDAFRQGEEDARRAKETELNRQTQEEQLRQLRLQRQLLEEQAVQLQKEREQREQQDRLSGARNKAKLEVEFALASLQKQYPDFEAKLERIAALARVLSPADNSPLTAKDYLEALYIVAKYASFVDKVAPDLSRTVEPLKDPDR